MVVFDDAAIAQPAVAARQPGDGALDHRPMLKGKVNVSEWSMVIRDWQDAPTGLWGFRSCGQVADLDQVVGQGAVSGPDSGGFGAVDAGTVPDVAAFEVTNAASLLVVRV
jgi:hypothetical protein